MRILFGKNKNFYKANLHSHTDYSDGHLSVEEAKEAYKARGYSIVAFTDHEHLIDNSRLNDDDFLTITSCEVAIKELPGVSTLKKLDMKVTHLNFYSKDPHNIKTPCYALEYDTRINEKNRDLIWTGGHYERVYTAEGINDIIRTASSEGFLVSYNHPTWSLETAADYLNYDGMYAVEVYNHSCMRRGEHDDEAAFEALLRAGKKIFCFASDDNHNAKDFTSPYCDSFGGWSMINADNLDYQEIMTALENGDFYASTGAEIYSICEDGGVVSVKTSKAKKITLLTKTRRVDCVIAPDDESVDSAEFELRDSDGFFRIRVETECGKKAWSQAFEV